MFTFDSDSFVTKICLAAGPQFTSCNNSSSADWCQSRLSLLIASRISISLVITIACIQPTLKFWLDNCLTDSLFRVVQTYVFFSCALCVCYVFSLRASDPLLFTSGNPLNILSRLCFVLWSIPSFSFALSLISESFSIMLFWYLYCSVAHAFNWKNKIANPPPLTSTIIFDDLPSHCWKNMTTPLILASPPPRHK